MKKSIAIIGAFLISLLILGCGQAELTLQQQKDISNDKEFYTTNNMWINKNKILSINYSDGILLPVNSKIKIIGATNRAIVFKHLNRKLSYHVSRRHGKLNASQTINKIFSNTPLKIDVNSTIKENILLGIVSIGMSKEEVILARGYPPLKWTKSLDLNTWRYYHKKNKNPSFVKFKQNKVVSANNINSISKISEVYIDFQAEYDGYIATNIKKECSIDTQIMDSISRYAKKKSIKVIVEGEPSPTDMVLKIYITDAISLGQGMTGGHYKKVTILGKLFKGDKLFATMRAARTSNGGAFRGFKGSCTVLKKCAVSLGQDVAYWLGSPDDDALLGEVMHIPKNYK